jgi:hypothetical protein
MRDSGEPGEDVVTTPYHSKVYTDAPATRSPILTVVLAIVILAILTALALSVVYWVQRRSANLHHGAPSNASFLSVRAFPVCIAAGLSIRKTDYELFLQ